MQDKKQINETRLKQITELRESTNIDPRSMSDVTQEATDHLLTHYKICDGPDFVHDYCFIMSRSYLGKRRNDPTKPVSQFEFYTEGDVHEFSHDLAGQMRGNPDLASFVLHAVQIYAMGGK